MAQCVNISPAKQETGDVGLIPGSGNPQKGMVIHSSILAWRIPWTEEPGSYSSKSCKKLDTTEQKSTHTQ